MIRLAWAPALLLTLPTAIAIVLLVVHVYDVNAGRNAFFEHITTAAGLSLGLLASALIGSRTASRYASGYLDLATRHNICFDCGYPLGPSQAARCPKCGFASGAGPR